MMSLIILIPKELVQNLIKNKQFKDYLRELRTRREEYDDPDLYTNPFFDWRSVSKTSKFDKATKVIVNIFKCHIDENNKRKIKIYWWTN